MLMVYLLHQYSKWFLCIYKNASIKCLSHQIINFNTITNKYSLVGKVIVVTGGTGILGNSFVEAIVEAGGTVGILGRKKEVAEERANNINANGGKAIALVQM